MQRSEIAVRCSARLCENSPLKSFLCFQPPLAGLGPLPRSPVGDAARTTTLRPRMSQPRAALRRGLSTRVTTRRRWYARPVTRHAVRPCSRPRLKQEPCSPPRCLVPHGGSPSGWRCVLTSGRLRPRCALAATRCASPQRVRRRPPVVRGPCGWSGQAVQADVAYERRGRPRSTVAPRQGSRAPAGPWEVAGAPS